MQPAAIVILNYNGEGMLRQFLPDVCKFSRYPVIVIDNGSTDGSVRYLEMSQPSVRLISLPANLGYTGGYNEGLGRIKGEFNYYILLNSDIQVGPGWDLPLVASLESDPNIASVQPKILSMQDPRYFDFAGAGGGYMDHLGYPYCRGRIFQTIEQDLGQYNDDIMVDWTSGACMAVRSELFHSHGGFDGRFFAHMEEIDLCWRWRQAGFSCKYLGSIQVLHVGGATLSRTSPRKTYLNFRNNLWMLRKNLSLARFSYLYMCRLLLDSLAALVFLGRGSLRDAVAVFKAHISFLFSGQGSDNKGGEAKSGNMHLGRNCILFDYYIRGKKKYSDL